ncbi:unnamed protein product [Hymenolepis diminuta]|uniref:Uncharacterized protein n=1 Tax=Hymenolepis diminuta TaxID=6216 RepID=A0A564YLL4_HYMDI|nr:unnamed protein product [Hymenolepis diminuta]VUZ47557.1 unnamed protein product [Hymenolepis diminuta]
MSKRPNRFPPFYNRLASPMSAFALMCSHVLAQWLLRSLLSFSPPHHAPLPLSLSLASILDVPSLNTFLALSWCSALQLFLALTQTATNW